MENILQVLKEFQKVIMDGLYTMEKFLKQLLKVFIGVKDILLRNQNVLIH